MKIIKEEKPEGTIVSITFRADGETQAELRDKVKVWIRNNYPSWNWEEFVNRLILWEGLRISISLQ